MSFRLVSDAERRSGSPRRTTLRVLVGSRGHPAGKQRRSRPASQSFTLQRAGVEYESSQLLRLSKASRRSIPARKPGNHALRSPWPANSVVVIEFSFRGVSILSISHFSFPHFPLKPFTCLTMTKWYMKRDMKIGGLFNGMGNSASV